jgi:hypothetical protein
MLLFETFVTLIYDIYHFRELSKTHFILPLLDYIIDSELLLKLQNGSISPLG